jgi:hypothetical protein
MFGTLKPQGCSVHHPELQEYHTFYCGMCKSLGVHYGSLTRVLVSHDSVFLALVVDGLLLQEAKADSCRCPMLPVVHRQTVEPHSVAMKFASATQILLGDQWLADRTVEGNRFAAWARPHAQPHVEYACSILEELGISTAPLRHFEDKQAYFESLWDCTPEQAAHPTAEALSYLFSTITSLPDVTEQAQSESTKNLLHSLGYALGQSIYWLDALEDLRKDFLARDFNPCLMPGLSSQAKSWQPSLLISTERVHECCSLLLQSLAKIACILDQIPWLRHQRIIYNVLTEQLPNTAQEVIEQAKDWASEEEKQELLAYRSLAWYARVARRSAFAFVFLWTWLSSTWSAFASDTRRLPSPSSSVLPGGSSSADGPNLPPDERDRDPSSTAGAGTTTDTDSDHEGDRSSPPTAKHSPQGKGKGKKKGKPGSGRGSSCPSIADCKDCCDCHKQIDKCCDACCGSCNKACDDVCCKKCCDRSCCNCGNGKCCTSCCK